MIMTSQLLVWSCQLISFAFQLSSTFRIRQLILSNSALSRQVDSKMVCDLLVLTSAIFVINFLCWLGFLVLQIDPDIPLSVKLDYS